jgi:uncharacterized membrane protein
MTGKVAVYLPHSYAISGYVVLCDRKEIRHITRMNAAESMKFAVSGGITSISDDSRTNDAPKRNP